MACRRKADKDALLRVVRLADGVVAVAAGSREHGRSAYVCASAACVAEAVRRGRLSRALKTPLGEADLRRVSEELICKLR